VGEADHEPPPEREIVLRPIGRVVSPHRERGDVPRGLGARHDAEGILELRPELEPGLRDIEGFSHLFVVWIFDRSAGWELVGVNPTDGLEHGVFATRSPHRPNPLALSVVQLVCRDGPRLHVRGVDMLDGSPVVDIKPYLSSVPPHELRRGWLAEAEARRAQSPPAR